MATKKKTMTSKQAGNKRKRLKKEGKSGIVIKPQNKGKFTKYLKKTGKTLGQALKSKNKKVRKMAVFAKNAKTWKH